MRLDGQPSRFSDYIRARRLESGLSLVEAARRTGIQPSRLHDLEQGRSSTTGKPTGPTRDNIGRLARGYAIPEELLLDIAGRPALDAATVEERQLVSQFRDLVPGHRQAVLRLVDELYKLDRPALPG